MKKTIVPSQIGEVLSMTLALNQEGKNIVPLFGGHAGVGKSENARKWAESQGPDFMFIDIRTAYQEAPDLKGFPTVVELTHLNDKGEEVKTFTTVCAIPEFLPKNGRGLIFWDEVNRGNSSVQNAMMQVLTDRKIDKNVLPKGFIQASAVNPEDTTYEVNNMDTALKNRFHIYDVGFDMNDFIAMARRNNWSESVVGFLDSGVWQFKTPEELKDGAPYVSPRNFGELNKLFTSEAFKTFPHLMVSAVHATIGEYVGNDFIKFVNEIKPVTLEMLKSDLKGSMKKLAGYADRKQYRGDLISVTVNSIVEGYKNKEADVKLVIKVAEVIDADQAAAMLTECLEAIGEEKEQKKIVDKLKKDHVELYRTIRKRWMKSDVEGNGSDALSAKKA